jgi:hypothetical protein
MAATVKNPELAAARAEYKTLTGKNPSPKLDAEGVRAKIAEIQAGPPAPAGDADAPADKAPAKPKAAKPRAEPTASPVGTAYVRHPEKIGCSYGGVELEPDKEGKLLVPANAVEELRGHGFEVC